MSLFSKTNYHSSSRDGQTYYCPNCRRFVEGTAGSSKFDDELYCPNCRRRLPLRLNEQKYLSIALVASKESGKSHFIGVLVEEINRLSNEFGWSFLAENDEIETLYKKRYYKRLYEEKLTVAGTNTRDSDEHAPLVYNLTKDEETTSVVLYDAAGELFYTETEMRRRRLDCARGIILLIDPLQIPEMREFLLQRDPDLKYSAVNVHTPVKEIMERMVRVLRKKYPDEKIPIPLAIVFTKIDAIRKGVTDDAPFYHPSLHRGGFSISDAKRIHEYVRRLTNGGVRIDQYCQHFQNVVYFGVSALGHAPIEGAKLRFKPRPIRVVDPFLWFLRLADVVKKID